MKKCLKRVMALFMTSSLLLSGCGAAESADDRKQETEGTETVELTVWGEKDNTATLTKMIDSFKEQYKAGQMYFRSRMTSLYRLLQAGCWFRFLMQKKCRQRI